MKLRLDHETEHGTYNDVTCLVIYQDGEEIFRGQYGGEPEDNSHYRDYKWVIKAIEQVAIRLGAEVEKTTSTIEDGV